MSVLIGIAAALWLQTTPPTQGWTWSLYGDDGPLVLANEVPDTPHLRTTFECGSGSGQVRLTQYASGITTNGPLASGPATLTSGRASAQIEAQGLTQAQGPRLQVQLRTNDPVFVAFVANGQLDLNLESASSQIRLDRANLPRLRRFAEKCTG